MKREILIIGGGITGVTTGIVLRLLGYPTRIACRHWLGHCDNKDQPYASDPRFASQYPAASIIPYYVSIEDEARHMQVNLRFFEALNFLGSVGVRRQRHYEVHEAPQNAESYAPAMPGYRPLPDDGSGEPGVPRRARELPIYGWSFQIHFAEMQRYRVFLTDLYLRLGGVVSRGEFLNAGSLSDLHVETIINCGGAWGPGFSGDRLPSRYVKGILVRADTGGRIPWNQTTGEVFSYKYHPVLAVYARPDGLPASVYFYPRSDCWLLGGTQFESDDLSAEDARFYDDVLPWKGESWQGNTVTLPQYGTEDRTVEVPAPLLTLNRDLIFTLTGADVSALPLSAMIGYRHKRSTVRLESDINGSSRVVHNYGHGGAGVTLSWSCAIRVAAMVRGDDGVTADQVIPLLIQSARRL